MNEDGGIHEKTFKQDVVGLGTRLAPHRKCSFFIEAVSCLYFIFIFYVPVTWLCQRTGTATAETARPSFCLGEAQSINYPASIKSEI